MRYKILWIDDEYKKQDDFIGAAEQEDLDVFPFESHEEGMEELMRNPDYHSVILDAKVKHKKDDTVSNLNGLRASRDYLIEHNKSHYLPFFIFTGQPDYAKEEWFQESYGEYFLKGRDNEKLFQAIKDAVLNKSEFLIERKYNRIFDACVDKYFGLSSKKILMNALKIVEDFQTVDNSDEFLNSLRKIYEKIFAAFHRQGLIPDEIFNYGGWINNSNKFLAGKHYDYNLVNEIYSPTIAFISSNVLFVTQDGSHNEGSLKLEVVKHIQEVKTSYLYKSLVFQTLDVICWGKEFLDTHPHYNDNKDFWVRKDKMELKHDHWIKGKVTKIKENGWGTFSSMEEGLPDLGIPPSIIQLNGLTESLPVLVKTKPGKSPSQPHIDKIKIDLI